jgi:hypothetical protein
MTAIERQQISQWIEHALMMLHPPPEKIVQGRAEIHAGLEAIVRLISPRTVLPSTAVPLELVEPWRAELRQVVSLIDASLHVLTRSTPRLDKMESRICQMLQATRDRAQAELAAYSQPRV